MSADRITSRQRRVIFVLGGPGAGKGTQCELAAQSSASTHHLSVGDVLRAEMRRTDSEYAEIIRKNMEAGAVGPAHITVELLRNAMDAKSTPADVDALFLIDGFPRKLDQAQLFEDVVCAPEKVVYLECPLDELKRRLLGRAAGGSADRFDDEEAIIEKRFNTFQTSAMDVIERYDQQGRVVRVDALNSVAAVSTDFREAMMTSSEA